MSDTTDDSKPSKRQNRTLADLGLQDPGDADSFSKQKRKIKNGRGASLPIDNSVTASPIYSDDYIALIFEKTHQNDARYVAKSKTWLFWSQTHWKEDRVLKAFNASRKVCREVALSLDEHSQQKKVASSVTIAAVEKLAKSSPQLGLEIDDWNRNIGLFNCPPENNDDDEQGERPHNH